MLEILELYYAKFKRCTVFTRVTLANAGTSYRHV